MQQTPIPIYSKRNVNIWHMITAIYTANKHDYNNTYKYYMMVMVT